MKILFIPLLLLVGLKTYSALSDDEYSDCILIYEAVRSHTAAERLYLMPAIDNEHEHMNKRFMEWANTTDFANVFTILLSNDSKCDLGYFTPLKMTEYLRTNYDVINLKMHIPVNYLDKHASPIGYVFNETATEDVYKCREYVEYDSTNICPIVKEKYEKLYTKFISPSIKIYALLYEFLQHINDKNAIKPTMPFKEHSIVICANKNDITDIVMSQFPYHVVENCENVDDFAKHRVLAVIAPKPFKNEEYTGVPVIFYDTPYLLPEQKDIYPNSATLYGNYFEEVAPAILQLIKERGWQRVAIVSDYSPNSDKFEDNIKDIFKENNIVYTAQECLGLTCDFTKALNWLSEVQARIIIANVGAEYAIKLADAAEQAGLTGFKKVLWIFREWPLGRDIEFHVLQKLGEIFVVTPKNQGITYNPNPNPNPYNMMDKISKAIDYIHEAIYTVTEEFYDPFNLEQPPITDLRVNISKIINSRTKTMPLSMSCNIGSDGNIYCFPFPTNTLHYFDLAASCYFRSNKFESPCEEIYLLLILLVCLTFLVTALTIITFFEKCVKTRDGHYRSLS